MEENKISIEWAGYDFKVTDKETGIEAILKEFDGGEIVNELSSFTETKLIIEE